jgi:hypothetical protein
LPEKENDVLCAHTVRRLKPGTLEPLEARQTAASEGRCAAIEPYVDDLIANGVEEVEVSWVPEGAPAT